MNFAWMLSSVLVSMLIGTAALCVERVLMLRRGAPVRWVWMTAIALSIAWSARWLLPAPTIVETPQAESSMPSELPDVVVMPSAASEATQSTPEGASAMDWTTTLAIMPVAPLSEPAQLRVQLAWLCMSVALLVALVWSHVRLMRERRHWRATSLLGSDVLVSNGFGPAIVGMRRPSIVVPPWVLHVDASAQRTIVLHEDEHRLAHDQWLLVVSFGALALAPWNVVLWLMRRRLARAIELDCDQRVLAHGVADVDYANVLLNAWQLARGAMPWAPTPALTEHVSRLGRRVEHLMRPVPQGILMKTIGGAFVSVVMMGAAVFVPAPQQAESRPAPPPAREQVPSVPPPPAQVPSVPAPQREQVPPVPAPLSVHTPPIPTPQRVPSPPVPATTPSRGLSLPAPAPSPSVPAPDRAPAPAVPAPAPVEPGGIQQKRARLLVVAPWDSASTPLVNAVHELLARDFLGQPVDVLSHAVFVSSASAAGFQPNGSLRVKLETDSKGFAPPDVKKLGELVRADLVIGLQVRQAPGFFHVYASVIAAGDSAPHRILEGDGSVVGVTDALMRALHADPAYSRFAPGKTREDLIKLKTEVRDQLLEAELLVQKAKADKRQPQSDAASAAPARAVFDSAFSFRFRLRPVANSWKTRFILDTTSRPFSFRFLPVANTWKTRFILDSTRRQFSFQFVPVAKNWFMRFGLDSTGRVSRFRSPPLG